MNQSMLMKRKFTLLLVAMIIAIAFFSLSACGRNRTDSYGVDSSGYGLQPSYAVTTAVDDEPDVRVLTALIPARFSHLFSRAAHHTRLEQQAMGNDFQLELTTFQEWGREDALTRLQIMTMAGYGYDLMIFDGQPFYAMAGSGFLVDFYDLIDQDPNLSRDDFFTQALEAFEFRGGLYAMPLNFGFEYVGINSRLPQSIINRFSQFSNVSMNDLLTLYLDLMQEYPQYNYLAFGPYFEFDRIVKFEMGSHIDTLERRSTLNDGTFESFLSKMTEVRQFNTSNFLLREDVNFMTQLPYQIEELAGRYVFSNHRYRMDAFNALFEFEDPLFSHFVPLADSHGRLKIDYGPWGAFMSGFCFIMGGSSTFASVMIGAGADKDLAWSMVLNMIAFVGTSGESVSDHRRQYFLCTSTPILRSLFDTHYDVIIDTLFPVGWGDGWGRSIGRYGNGAFQPTVGGPFIVIEDGEALLTSAAHTQIANMKERILGYTEMPMVTPPFSLPSSVYESALSQLILGIITPQVAVQDIHNRVSLWLIE